MNITEVVVRGTLTPEGTVRFDTPPALPLGPVEGVLRSIPSGTRRGEDWWQYLQRARAAAEAAGGPFRSQEEIERDRADFRRDDDDVEADGVTGVSHPDQGEPGT